MLNLNLVNALRGSQRIKNVEIGDKPIKAVIIRDGKEIKTPTVDSGRILDFIGGLKPVDRRTTPRLVQQSIPAGTFVARGTPVDLVFVPPADINVGILDGIHVGMRDRSVSHLLGLLDDDALKAVVNKGDARQLTDADRTLLKNTFEREGIEIDDGDAGKSTDMAYKTLLDIQAFK